MSNVDMFFWKVKERSIWLVRSKRTETKVTAEGPLKSRGVRPVLLQQLKEVNGLKEYAWRHSGSSNNMVSCSCNVDEAKNRFRTRATSVWGLHVLPRPVWPFSRSSRFLPHPEMCMWGEWACLHCPRVSEWGCQWPYSGRASCPGWVPVCALSCHDRLQPLQPRLGISGMENHFLLVFVHLS